MYAAARKTPARTADCTALNFDEIIRDMGATDKLHVDYISIDLEPAETTFRCLLSIPFDKITASVITFEHDSYRFGNLYRDASRNVFKDKGYILISSDVANGGNIYEDWYINPKHVDMTRIKPFICDAREWTDIVFKNSLNSSDYII